MTARSTDRHNLAWVLILVNHEHLMTALSRCCRFFYAVVSDLGKAPLGSLEASPEDNCLFGKLQFIRALVSYEGVSVAELAQAFRDAVDDYL